MRFPDDFKVQLAHARDDRLAGWSSFVKTAERRIFFREGAGSALDIFFLVELGFWGLESPWKITGSGKDGGFQQNLVIFNQQKRVSPVVMFANAHDGRNVARVNRCRCLRRFVGPESGSGG